MLHAIAARAMSVFVLDQPEAQQLLLVMNLQVVLGSGSQCSALCSCTL